MKLLNRESAASAAPLGVFCFGFGIVNNLQKVKLSFFAIENFKKLFFLPEGGGGKVGVLSQQILFAKPLFTSIHLPFIALGCTVENN